jgi:leucyl aminopeptidase
MTGLSVRARQGAPEETDGDTRVVGLFEDEELPAPLAEAFAPGEARGPLKKVAVGHEDAGDAGVRRVIVVGLGKRAEFDAERARVAAAVVAGRASEIGSTSLSWGLPIDDDTVAGGLVEGTLLKLYRFDRFKSSSDDGDENTPAPSITLLEIASPELDTSDAVRRAEVLATAQNAARDLQNLPANVATPEFLANRARELADEHSDLEVEVLGREDIKALGMGAFAAVAQGSHTEPQLIILRYSPAEATGPHLGYVGKAVTFDTGGISIKPSAKMQEMKFDMSGGAAVIESIGAIAQLGLPARVTGVVPATENMPSGHATKPGDIVTAMNGKTIEINNTDAEGRLILADALCYAVEQGCERLVDIATLTGAIVVTFGHTHAGLFSNDDDWCAAVEAAGNEAGEIGWRLPLHAEYFDLTKGKYADLTNASEQRAASSIYAAEFLRQFADGQPWVHMDIAGVAWGMSRAYVGNGASGFGVRTLTDLAQRLR